MSLVNYTNREINIKVVYYGPGLSGKTTNLQYIHRKLNPKQRGKLLSLATETDRTLFFDFLPLSLGYIKGFKTRFHVYTVPGQVHYNETRKMVLKGADGIVFVADSQPQMMEDNIESFKNLQDNLKEMGRDIEDLPLVLQYNKRDLENAAPLSDLNEALNLQGYTALEAVALSGEGVLKSFTEISKLALKKVREKPTFLEEEKVEENELLNKFMEDKGTEIIEDNGELAPPKVVPVNELHTPQEDAQRLPENTPEVTTDISPPSESQIATIPDQKQEELEAVTEEEKNDEVALPSDNELLEEETEEAGLPLGVEMEVGFELEPDDLSDEVANVWESADFESQPEVDEDEAGQSTSEIDTDETISIDDSCNIGEESIEGMDDTISIDDENIDFEEDENEDLSEDLITESIPNVEIEDLEDENIEEETNEEFVSSEEENEVLSEDLMTESITNVESEALEDEITDESIKGPTVLSLDSTGTDNIQLGQPENKGGGSFSIPIIINKDDISIEMKLNLSLDIETIKGQIVATEGMITKNNSSVDTPVKETFIAEENLLSEVNSSHDENHFGEENDESSIDFLQEDDNAMSESDLDTSFLDEVIDMPDETNSASNAMEELDDEKWIVEEEGQKKKKGFLSSFIGKRHSAKH